MIFPNPTCTDLNVCYNLTKEDDITIALYDMHGKLILKKNIGKQLVGEQQQTLDVSHLSNGTYMCRIEGLHQSVTKTVIKN
jgi:hypothetical protein